MKGEECRGKPHFNNIIKFVLIFALFSSCSSSFCASSTRLTDCYPARKFNIVNAFCKATNTAVPARKTALIFHVELFLWTRGKRGKDKFSHPPARSSNLCRFTKIRNVHKNQLRNSTITKLRFRNVFMMRPEWTSKGKYFNIYLFPKKKVKSVMQIAPPSTSANENI